MPAVQFSSRQLADVVVASPTGRIDHGAARQFEESLLPLLDAAAPGQGGVLLDFSGVDYISSVGLRALMIAGKRMHARGAALAIATLQPVVAEIFAISRFNGLFRVYPSVREALAAMSPAALAAFDRG
jgi:anti-anti-sigma factor